jgi:chaperonin cofactor prefoldin
MNRRTLVSVAVFALAGAAFVPGLARAQGSTPAPQATEQNTTTPTTAVTTTSATTASTTTAPAKKVWTNEDMGDVHKNSVISTFSGTNGKPGNAKPAANPKGPKDAKGYVDQIKKLQDKLPPLDEQISQLQAALNGDTVNSTRHYGGQKIDDWHDELARLQKQREDIATKISALQDQARRNGVPENQIPE